MNLVPEFLCTLTGMDSMAGDIAISSTGGELQQLLHKTRPVAVEQLVPTSLQSLAATSAYSATPCIHSISTRSSQGTRPNRCLLQLQ